MRFYLDEDLSPRVAQIGRSMNLDVVSSHEVGNNGLPDEDQLWFAAQEGRCLVTRNRDDFEQLTIRFFAREESHLGVVIVMRSIRSDNFSAIARGLADLAAANPGDLPSCTIRYLSGSQPSHGF